MLKLNKVATMVAAALYVGSGAAATDAVKAAGSQDSQWTVAPADYAPQPLPQETYTWENQVNKTIKKQQSIFVAENDVSGVNKYIVQLSDAPISTYNGGIASLASTQKTVSKARLSKAPLNLNQSDIKAYSSYLAQKRATVVSQAQALQGLNVQVGREYSVALNGFVTELTQEEAVRLAKIPGVKRITREKVYELQTFSTPTQTGATSVWSGSALNSSNKGEGMVVGIIDTGINTDHPSFAAVGGDGYQHTNPLGSSFLGDCAASPEYCNDKLIGVYSYPEITQAYSDPVFSESRPAIGEDYNNHGSHVAGTVAGNVLMDVNHVISENTKDGKGIETGLVLPQVSGMAPHANIIAYQVCWPGGSGDPYAGCPTSAIIAAVEQSAIDNVDVINASLGGLEEDPWLEPIEQAFYNAAASGVFVAVAAGNSGPYLQSADHSSPWVTTVAAHTADQIVTFADNGVEQMSGGDTTPPSDIVGATKSFESASGMIVDATNFANPNESYAPNVKNCDSPFPAGTFDLADNPDTADIDESQQDVIVICSRSSKPLIYKADNVKAGGAEGVVITNLYSFQDSNIPGIPYSIPGTLIPSTDGKTLRTWVNSGAGHMGTLSASAGEISDVDKERVANFSGRGPSYFGIDTLFVDIAAPGVDIFAAASDDQPFTSNPYSGEWATLSGTSMASPHVAGAAALLRQSHPYWTPMQVQSALMMTASKTLTNAGYLDNYSDYGELSGLHDAGAGRMHVELADKVGLVLDESMDNMAAANPNLGGYPKNLNTAYMVDNDCPKECSFVRTFTATEDASWTVDTEAWFGDFEISAQPESFSLKAGETQSIVITAKALQNVSAATYTDLTGNQGQVRLVSDNPSSPVLELPIWTYAGDSGLPDYLKINAHRKSSTLNVGPFNTAEITDFTSRSFGLVKGENKTIHTYTDTTGADPFDLIEGEDGAVNPNHIEWTDVPEGAKLLAGSVVGDEYNRVLVFMGQDSDGDGLPSMEETLCMSTNYSIANFCTITEPHAGRYFTVYMNLATISTGEVDLGRDITISTALVDVDNSNLTVSAPAQIPGYEEYNLELAYNLPEMEVGDTYFGGFDIGSNANDAGNLGFVPVIINQIDKDVNFSVNKQNAKPGDVLEFEVSVIANNEESARDFALKANFPEGIQIIPDSVVASHATPGEPVLEANSLSLEGVQETTKDVVRNYLVTNNQNDPMCSLTTANSPTPGYLELRENFGWRTLEGVEGDYRNTFEYKLSELMNTSEDITFPFFNKYHVDTLKLSPAGLLSFNSARRIPSFHTEFPEAHNMVPEYVIAPYWVGDNAIPQRYDGGYGEYHLNAGITPTYTYSREWLVLEWDNVERSRTPGQLVDFEMFLRTNINYEPGEYEMLFAYDNLQMVDDQGTIGFKAADGRIIVDGDMPIDINLGDSVAYNNLGDVISDQFVVCMDYTGPEQSQFNLKFNAYVSEKAAGTTQTLVVENHLVGSDVEQLELQVDVTGNINLADIANIFTEENEEVSFEVYYSDENAVSNIIEVTGENFSVEIDGNVSGSKVTLKPKKHFNGETEVTVTVRDSVNSGDASSTSFKLIVGSDGVELGCTDSSADNYNKAANTDDGSCEYAAEEESEEANAAEDKSAGGALGWLVLALLPFAIRRRKSF
ncbi:S8 family serine peptidase [Shewanella sp. Isolate11]|uniref:S8 family serine peptidase n=1 Tax=Shewanella sp. Isolate11 TaxID=2908530 RepID=UPI001EFD6535|nr:S8 family serine peptidase [Shewanella sp. Isolate11]MCG9697677.1 S8 family serine peptidase [Shewanella sp. Isolate11]